MPDARYERDSRRLERAAALLDSTREPPGFVTICVAVFVGVFLAHWAFAITFSRSLSSELEEEFGLVLHLVGLA